MNHPYIAAIACIAMLGAWTLIAFLAGKSEGYWEGWYARDNDQDCPPRHTREKDNPPRSPS